MRILILGIDGFLGWPLALWLKDKGHDVAGVDNFSRRDLARSVVPIASYATRSRLSGIEMSRLDVRRDESQLFAKLSNVKPDIIVHYAENPSAPYSMRSRVRAVEVMENNVLGTLNLLFTMRDACPNATLVKLGTMGEYGTPMSGRPIYEGVFPDDATLNYWQDRSTGTREKLVCPMKGEMIPKDPGSFYHLSKAHDSLNIKKACDWWGLRAIDIMQGVIYGCHTPQTTADEALRTRFDIDQDFGTVINRFSAQAVIGHPLTVYGKGGQTRGYLALEDAMRCMEALINKPPNAGEYEVVNQFTGVYSVNEIADMVRDITGAEIQHIDNPRVEAEIHSYNPVHDKLPNKYGFVPQVELKTEIERTIKLLSNYYIKRDIERQVSNIMPTTTWK